MYTIASALVIALVLAILWVLPLTTEAGLLPVLPQIERRRNASEFLLVEE